MPLKLLLLSSLLGAASASYAITIGNALPPPACALPLDEDS